MEVDNKIYDLIVKESCCSLCYSYSEQQFSYPLRSQSCLNNAWGKVSSLISKYSDDFYLEDFNNILINIERIVNIYSSIDVCKIGDYNLLTGEILKISLEGTYYIRIMKMSPGQYLNLDEGSGISFGTKVCFQIGKSLNNSEDLDFGLIRRIEILCPMKEHLALSRIFLKGYYNKKISKSLWNLYDEACYICNTGASQNISNLEDMARDMGVGSFVLLNIVNAALKV